MTEHLHNPFTIAFVFLVMSAFIAYLVLSKLRYFKSYNSCPEFNPFRPQKDDGTETEPVQILTGLHLTEILAFEPQKNDFLIEGYVWFQFNPTLVPMSAIQEFSFERGSLLFKEEEETKVLPNKELFTKYKFRLRLSPDLNFKNFPLDDHRLFLVISSEKLSSKEFAFTSSQSHFEHAENISLSGWKIKNTLTDFGYKPNLNIPCVLFAIDFARDGVRKALTVIIPIVVIFYVGFTSLLQIERVLDQLLASGAITGLLAYRFVIETMSPNVSYFTLSDHIFTLFLTSAFLVFVLNIYTLNVPHGQLSAIAEFSLFTSLPIFIMVSLYGVFRKLIVS